MYVVKLHGYLALILHILLIILWAYLALFVLLETLFSYIDVTSNYISGQRNIIWQEIFTYMVFGSTMVSVSQDATLQALYYLYSNHPITVIFVLLRVIRRYLLVILGFRMTNRCLIAPDLVVRMVSRYWVRYGIYQENARPESTISVKTRELNLASIPPISDCQSLDN